MIWLAALAVLVASFAVGYMAHDREADTAHPARTSVVPASLRVAVLAELRSRYYRVLPAPAERASSVPAMLDALDDPYTEYLGPTAYDELLDTEAGGFGGVGLALGRGRHGLVVRALLPGQPASRAGIEPGDVITSVDDTTLQGVPYGRAVDLMHGDPGTSVRLTVVPRGRTRPLLLTLVRSPISVSQITSRMIRTHDGRALYVRLPAFTEHSSERVRALVQRAAAAHADVVLDLRGNTGGLLDEAVGVARVFVPQDVIVSINGRHQPPQVLTGDGTAIAGPRVVVLVDGATASAAEVVAGSLQADLHAKVVGTPTFGKGTVQAVRPMPGGGALKLTVAEFRLVGGKQVNGRGIRPDVSVVDHRLGDGDQDLAVALRQLAAS
jgi:carboxyl-terminal processing protease